MLPFTFASPPKTRPKKAPHRFAILRLTIANLKREDEYSLEVQREYLESFADREGHPHGFTGAKQDMGTCEIFKIYQDAGISGYSTERPVPSVLRS